MRRGQPQQRNGRLVREHDPAVQIGDDNRLRQPLKHRFKQAGPLP
jgi:hypothetical protein